MINRSQKIGIWGFGVVGKSVTRYLQRIGCQHLSVMDRRLPTSEEQAFLDKHGIQFFVQDNVHNFLEKHDVVIPSPGIDLRPYATYHEKFYAELDLFFNAWHHRAPIIAITGTIGKTSVTHLLSELLKKAGKKVVTCGNIGTGMLDMVATNEPVDYVIIELSSYQLERVKIFAPDVAIWTNFYPKHLDRHGTAAEYFAAKSFILRYQKHGQYALIPHELLARAQELNPSGEMITFSVTHSLGNYFLSQQTIFKNKQSIATTIPASSFATNWLIITAALDILGIDVPTLLATADTLKLPEHRLQLVATVGGVEFYNDSKSTIMEATYAAVNRLGTRPVILLLGGISDAGDRRSAIQQLAGKVEKVICFGAEAPILVQACLTAAIATESYPNLEEAFHAAHTAAQPGSCVLLSPGGPSFDLFKDYTERGRKFCELVSSLKSCN